MKKLLILSGKGGTGKTTVSSAFISFANAEAYADCDVDAPNLHLINSVNGNPITKEFIGSKKAMINIDKCTSCGLCYDNCRFDSIKKFNNFYQVLDYACEGCGVCEYVCPNNAITLYDDVAGELYLYKQKTVFSTATLKMGRGNSGKLVSEVKRNLMTNTNDQPIAIIDGSPGVGCPVIASIGGVDLVLVVTEPSLSGFSDLERLIKTITLSGVRPIVCINKFDINMEKTEEIKLFCENNNISFVGEIPYDENVLKAVNQGTSIANIKCKAQEALYKIYLNTLNYL